MIKTKKAMRTRGVRFEDEKWDRFTEIAKRESKITKTIVTPSDVVRHAANIFLEELNKKS